MNLPIPHHLEKNLTLYEGEALETLKAFRAHSVDCIVSSPPYWKLRDYEHEEQVGWEATWRDYCVSIAQIFNEAKRVLRPQGTCWINIGDRWENKKLMSATDVARQLTLPSYAGVLSGEGDRIWLAAMIDTEGCIYIHKRKAGSENGKRKTDTYSPNLQIANTSRALVERIMALAGGGSIRTDVRGRNQPLHIWTAKPILTRTLLSEVYPHLIGKKHEARIALACPAQGASDYHEALKLIHQGIETTFDAGVPDSLWSSGWNWSQTFVWHKPNQTPYGAKQRQTQDHEYVFMLTKADDYFWNRKGVMVPAKWERWGKQTIIKNYRGIKPIDMDSLEQRRKDGKPVRTVWSMPTKPYKGRHDAAFPPALAERCIRLGCKPKGLVLDPFIGSGSTAAAAKTTKRRCVGIDLRSDFLQDTLDRWNDT